LRIVALISLALAATAAPAQLATVLAGQTVAGTLASGDAVTALGSFRDDYLLEAASGEAVVIEAHSEAVDLVLELRGQSGRRWMNDDASPDTVDPRLDVTLDEPGPFLLWVHAFRPGETGDYTLTVTDKGASPELRDHTPPE
jgi:hypothetical protein